jgi:hypothetical protein
MRMVARRGAAGGTTRRDGTPRISGAEPLVMDGDLWLSMMSASTKARDLHRDRRILLHSIITGPEPAPELKLRGSVREETSPPTLRRYADAVASRLGWQPVVGRFTLFSVDIDAPEVAVPVGSPTAVLDTQAEFFRRAHRCLTARGRREKRNA